LSWGESVLFLTATLSHLAFREALQSNRPVFAVPESLRLEFFAALNDEAYVAIGDEHLAGIESAFEGYRLVHHVARNAMASSTDPERHRRLVGALMYYSNLLLTAVEQHLVTDVLYAVVDSLPRRIARFLPEGYARACYSAWARFFTRQVLVLDLESERFRVGLDVPKSDKPVVSEIDDVLTLKKGLAENDRERDSVEQRLQGLVDLLLIFGVDGDQTAVQDWRAFGDRMSWIASFVNAFQYDARIRDTRPRAPFGPLCSGSADRRVTTLRHRFDLPAERLASSTRGAPLGAWLPTLPMDC
jgi:hypothetical protein